MKQLRMNRPTLHDLPPVAAPPDYAFRTYLDGDEAAWGAIMNTGIGSDWTVEKVQEQITRAPQFVAGGLYFATHEGLPVGSTCAWREHAAEWKNGIVHMVCVLPEHRGHGLGYQLTLAVLHWFRAHSFERATLTTDDWRLSAIKAYLALGFLPDVTNAEMQQRWVAVARALHRDDLAAQWEQAQVWS
jgi:mycothiol synthase